MSGRIDPGQIIARLDAAVTDGRLSWLDELFITAGYRYCCDCAAMVPADRRCGQRGHTNETCTSAQVTSSLKGDPPQ